MSNKKGIAFYLDRKFIVYDGEIIKKPSIHLNYNIEECFKNIKNIVYSYDDNDIIIRIFSDSLIFIADKSYENDDWIKSNNRLIKLANTILAVMFSTSSEFLNIKKGETTFFIHDKEINVKNIMHCTANDEYNEIDFKSCDATIKLDDIMQRDDINYTTAIKSNMLYMNGVISKDELEKIDFARKKRNSIAHANFEFQDKLDFATLSQIFLTSIDLFAKYYNINFKMQYGFEG